MKFKSPLLATTVCVFLATTSFSSYAADVRAVVKTYADIALAMYTDAQTTAQILKRAVDKLAADPTSSNLNAARAAWIDARVPYQQTEGLRFGNSVVDDWEGKVNAWPLDEGLIDYVDAGYRIAQAQGTHSRGVQSRQLRRLDVPLSHHRTR